MYVVCSDPVCVMMIMIRVHGESFTLVTKVKHVSHFVLGIIIWILKAYGRFCNDCNAGKLCSL